MVTSHAHFHVVIHVSPCHGAGSKGGLEGKDTQDHTVSRVGARAPGIPASLW